jgi:hypothetical protein
VKKLDDATDMTSGMVELFKKEAAAMTLLSHHPSLANFVGACWYAHRTPPSQAPKDL